MVSSTIETALFCKALILIKNFGAALTSKPLTLEVHFAIISYKEQREQVGDSIDRQPCKGP